MEALEDLVAAEGVIDRESPASPQQMKYGSHVDNGKEHGDNGACSHITNDIL